MDWLSVESEHIVDYRQYVVFAIGQTTGSPNTYLYQPEVRLGWQFKRLLKGCYVAIPMPDWHGVEHTAS